MTTTPICPDNPPRTTCPIHQRTMRRVTQSSMVSGHYYECSAVPPCGYVMWYSPRFGRWLCQTDPDGFVVSVRV